MKRHPYLLRASSYFRLAEKARRAGAWVEGQNYQRVAEQAISDFRRLREQQAKRKQAR